MKEKKEVFVTYSWDSEEHKNKVISFTDLLRKKGFVAEIDRMHSQNETATDFKKMMHRAMTDYEKVIVVLSKGYKEKAEAFKGGVGNEYLLIIKDIEESKQKYILVTFEPISKDITPLDFKNREILNLNNEDNFNILFAKLKGEKLIEFSEVASEKPIIKKEKISDFEVNSNSLEIIALNSKVENCHYTSNLIKYIGFELNLEIRNNLKTAISDYSIEIYYPKKSVSLDGRIDGKYKIISYSNNPKLYPSQIGHIKIEKIIIQHYDAKDIITDVLIVKVFSEFGVVEKEYKLSETLECNLNHKKEKLTLESFLE